MEQSGARKASCKKVHNGSRCARKEALKVRQSFFVVRFHTVFFNFGCNKGCKPGHEDRHPVQLLNSEAGNRITTVATSNTSVKDSSKCTLVCRDS